MYLNHLNEIDKKLKGGGAILWDLTDWIGNTLLTMMKILSRILCDCECVSGWVFQEAAGILDQSMATQIDKPNTGLCIICTCIMCLHANMNATKNKSHLRKRYFQALIIYFKYK